jgi:hypothetical protein
LTSRLLPCLVLCCRALASPAPAPAQIAGRGGFHVRFDPAGIASLTRAGDPAAVEYIASGSALGQLIVRYRSGHGEVRQFSTADPANKRSERPSGSPRERIVVYNESGWHDGAAGLELTERFRLEDDALYWTVHLRNLTRNPLELGDVLLPAAIGRERERFMVGHEWYPYWRLSDARAPYLLMMPLTAFPPFEPPEHERSFIQPRFEHFDDAGLYIHSAFAARGRFSTAHTLAPGFSPGGEVTWVFKFCWAAGLPGLQKALSAEGLLSDANGIPE